MINGLMVINRRRRLIVINRLNVINLPVKVLGGILKKPSDSVINVNNLSKFKFSSTKWSHTRKAKNTSCQFIKNIVSIHRKKVD